METVVFYESGRKRRGVEEQCRHCGKVFVRRINGVNGRIKIYCTRKCSGLAQRDRVKLVCWLCGTCFERPGSHQSRSKHGVYFCSRKCKDTAQRVESGCEEIQPPHYGNGHRNYRGKCKDDYKLGCVGCGEKPRWKLEVHHKDGDRCNNKKDNLEVVCKNCHAKRHLKLADGEWVFDFNYLTPREMLDRIPG